MTLKSCENALFTLNFIRKHRPDIWSSIPVTDRRRLLIYFSLSIVTPLTLEQLRFVSGFSEDEDSITTSNLRMMLSRLMKSGFIAGDRSVVFDSARYTLYTLRKAAFPIMKHLADSLLVPAGFEPVDVRMLEDTCKNAFAGRIGRHRVELNMAYLSIFFSDFYISHPVPLFMETVLSLDEGGVAITPKKQGELAADISMQVSDSRFTCFEIDLNTEHRNVMLRKTAAYCHVQYTGNYSVNLSPVDLVYLVTDPLEDKDGGAVSALPSELYTALKGRNAHFYSFIMENFASSHCQWNGTNRTMEVPLTVHECILTLKEQQYRGSFDKGISVYRTVLELLQFIESHFDENGIYHEKGNLKKSNKHTYGKMPVSLLPQCMETLCNIPDIEPVSTSNYSERKRNLFYKMIAQKGDAYGITTITPVQGSTGSLLRGMMLGCIDATKISELMPFLFPEILLKTKAEAFMHNISLTSSPNAWTFSPNPRHYPRSVPLRGDSTRVSYGMYSERYGTFIRNCFNVNGLTVCIENISHDIGGFIRTVEYMKMPTSLRPRTLLICLVADDGIMANGESIYQNGLYHDWKEQETGERLISFRGTEQPFSPAFMYERALKDYHRANDLSMPYILPETGLYLPFLTDYTQDYCVLTYSEFRRALNEPVQPWIPMGGDCRVGRGPLEKGKLLPHVPTGFLEEGQLPPLYLNI